MHRRAFSKAILVFQIVWLNVVIPGHTRGVVTLPGTSCESCLESQPACCRRMSSHGPRHAPNPDPARNCAICHFALRLSLPPAISFAPPPLGRAEVLDPLAPESAASVRFPTALRDRAPPLLA